MWHFVYNVTYSIEPGYNDTGLCDTSYIMSHIPWYEFFAVNYNVMPLGYSITRNDTESSSSFMT